MFFCPELDDIRPVLHENMRDVLYAVLPGDASANISADDLLTRWNRIMQQSSSIEMQANVLGVFSDAAWDFLKDTYIKGFGQALKKIRASLLASFLHLWKQFLFRVRAALDEDALPP